MGGRGQLPQRIADRFAVQALLGEGAMGQVFRVYDEHEDRIVALKLLKPERSEAGQLQRFKREFRAAARLHHPYCVRSFELVEHAGLAMITMEHVAGGPLALHRWERPEDVIRLALQLLAGLDHIHGKQLIHRDLKPSNILIEPTDGPPHPRLTDFGIADFAELSHEDTAVGLVQGSLRYLAPETLESGVADPRSDLYSLGLILYALLAGQHPFGSTTRTLREWLATHRRGRMRPLAQVRPDVPAPLVELVHRLCSRQPEDRFVDAAAAHEELRALWPTLANDEPPPVHPPLVRRPYLSAPAFVGRSAEKARLLEALEHSRQGRGPCVVQVMGDAGQGKSRLLRELLVEVLDGDTMVFPGTCRAEGVSPYEPVGDLLEALEEVELDGDDTPVQLLHPRTPGLAGPDDPTADVSLGSSPSPTSMLAELRPPSAEPEDGMSGRLAAHARWSAGMRLLCRRRPVLLLLEDAQWADPPTLQLLTAMVRAMVVAREHGDPVRATLVLSHRRTADDPDLDTLLATAEEHRVLASIDLSPLPAASARQVLASMLMMPAAALPAAFAEPLITRAEGSPLFLAQMLHSLLGRGQLSRTSAGAWQLESAELSAARLPSSVDKAIGERAARLATEHKQLMVAAAVIGRQFGPATLGAVTGLDEHRMLDGLDELVRGGFVEDHERSYRFVHDRIRESILGEVPASERRSLHAQVAEHLLASEGERPSAWPGLAHHLEQAEDHPRAMDYALRAARHATETHAHGAALELYAAAQRVAARGELALGERFWELQADAHSALGHYPQAVADFERQLEVTAGVRERAELLSKLGYVEYKQGNYHRAIEVFERVLTELAPAYARVSLPTPVWLALSIMASLLPARRWHGSPQAAEVLLRTRSLLAESYFMAGKPTSTARHSVAAANLARRLGPSPESVRALALNGMGMVTYGQARLGLRQLARARTYSHELEAPDSVRCHLQVFEALSALVQGQVERAWDCFEDAWRRFGAAPSAEARVYVLSAFTHAMVLIGRDRRRCDHFIRRMQALADELNDTRMRGAAAYCRGYLAVCDGTLDAAISSLRLGLRLSSSAGDRRMEQTTTDLLVVALALHGELSEALERGQAAAEAVLADPGGRSFMCHDAGLPIAAAEALRRGEPLPPAIATLVRRVLRHRRREALALPTAASLFRVATAAWDAVHGRPHELAEPARAAEHLGLRGEAALCRVVAQRFATAGARNEPHALPP